MQKQVIRKSDGMKGVVLDEYINPLEFKSYIVVEFEDGVIDRRVVESEVDYVIY